MPKFKPTVLFALVLCLSLFPLHADKKTGKASVYVFTAAGMPFRGVKVSVGETTMTTNENGSALLPLEQGKHYIVLDLQGREVARVPVMISAGETAELILTLDQRKERIAHVDLEAYGRQNTGEPAPQPSKPADRRSARQAGRVLGRVLDVKSGKPVEGARIYVRGQTEEALTDTDGQFSITLPPGTYSLAILHANFATVNLEDVAVEEKSDKKLQVELTSSSVELASFEVVAMKITGGLVELVEEKKEADEVVDVIGAEQISKAGDSNAASALKRVTGLTVIGGKYIYVRGMGERYSSSLLNGSSLPSPEPERRVVPLNLFPSDIIESVAIQKTYSPDMPGEFGGGAVQIRTKHMPKERIRSLSLSGGMNDNSTFRHGFGYEGGSLDELGYDDGDRDVPPVVTSLASNQPIFPYSPFTGVGLTDPQLEQIGESLPNVWSVSDKKIGPDTGLGFTYGDLFKPKGIPVGLISSVSYGNSTDIKSSRHRTFVPGGGAGGKYVTNIDYDRRSTEHNIDLSTMVDLETELKDHSVIRFTNLVLRTTQDKAERYQGFYASESTDIRVTELDWVENMLINNSLSGEHKLPGDHFELGWNYSKANASRKEPDKRTSRYDLDSGTGLWFLSGRPEGNQRFYSDLDDDNQDMALNLSYLFKSNGRDGRIQSGVNLVNREREVKTRRFKFNSKGPKSTDNNLLVRTPEEIFSPANIDATGFQIEEITRKTDNYNANQDITAYYIMATVPLKHDIDVSAGVRTEKSEQKVETFELFSTSQKPIPAQLDTDDLLPALNTTWSFTKQQQLRAAYSQTLSRPDFRELSEAPYDQVIGDGVVKGNPKLKRTLIDNYDLRWEFYPNTRDFLSAAVFYKELENPIEIIILPGSNMTTTYDNAASATNVGLELEVRKSLDFMRKSLKDYYISNNVALIESSVDLNNSLGIATSKERALFGQSPYVINLQLGYENPDTGRNASLLYNVYGKRITAIGVNGMPDVYEQPYHQLDFVYAWGATKKRSYKFKMKNILDQSVVLTQGGEEKESYKTGRELSLSVSFNF